MGREWKPGDVAMHPKFGRGIVQDTLNGDFVEFENYAKASATPLYEVASDLRPLVVIDPEDFDSVVRLMNTLWDVTDLEGVRPGNVGGREMQAALREFANPTPPKPDEPTDPAAVVTDRRENVWRLLATGDWVCTSGPDVGEYLNWDQLAGDRGPVTIEVDR